MRWEVTIFPKGSLFALLTYSLPFPASACAATPCDSVTDQALCCKAVEATCAYKNGVGAAASPITDAECGDWFLASSSPGNCQGAVCDMGVAEDKSACCTPVATCGDKVRQSERRSRPKHHERGTHPASIAQAMLPIRRAAH